MRMLEFALSNGSRAYQLGMVLSDIPQNVQASIGFTQPKSCMSCCNAQFLMDEIPCCERLNNIIGTRDRLFINDRMICAFYNVPKDRDENQGAWAKKIYRRDKYTCQRCGSKDTPLHAHHIHSFSFFPHLAWDLDNGITLCESCHYKVHAKKRHDGIYFVNGVIREKRKAGQAWTRS